MVTLIVCAFLLTSITGTIEGKVAGDQTKPNCEQNGYKQYSTGCYKLHDTAMTFNTASSTCAGEGASLVIINDSAEADTVTNIYKDSDGSYGWVGLRDESGHDSWRSVHDDQLKDLYHVWAESHTNKYKCGALKYTGELDDVPCDNEHSFVCEI